MATHEEKSLSINRATSQFATNYVSLSNGERIFFRGHTKSNESPIILLHGLSQQSLYWAMVSSHLRRSIISVDLRGHGLSQGFTANADFSVDRVAHDIVDLMKCLDISRAHIVGHSWGASIALRFALIAPDSALSCVLLDGGAVNPTDLIPDIVKDVDDLRTILTPPEGPFSWSMLLAHYQEIDAFKIEDIMSAIKDSYIAVRPNEYVTKLGFIRHMRILDELMSYDHISDLENTRVATWVIFGHSGDLWDGSKSEKLPLLAKNPLMHIQNWYGCHHDLPLQRPAEVAELISTIASMTDD